MKPGIKTSEFWLTLFAQVLGALLASGVIAPESNWAKVAGAVLMGLTALGYGISRGMAKSPSGSESGRAFLPVIGLAALLVFAAGCSTTYIDKRVVFHPRSVINGRPEVMVPGEIDSSVADGEKGTRDVTGPTGPTGSASGEVTGSNGVINIVIHQDDGTGTTAETTPTTDVDVSGLPQ